MKFLTSSHLFTMSFALMTFAGTLAAALPATAADTNGGTITITGTVEDHTCELDKADTPVTLDTVSAVSLMNAKGTDVSAKDFTLSLKNCGEHAGTVKISVKGSPDSADTSAFANEAKSNPATDVAMNFYSLNGTTPTKVKPGGNEVTQSIKPTASKEASLNFRAAYVATGNAVTAGSFKSVLTFSLDYD
ncbi:type 1 fimbrial protein [Salmonella enterica]